MLAVGFLLTLGPSAPRLKKKPLENFYSIVFVSNNRKNMNLTLNTLHLMGFVFFQQDLRNPSVNYEIGSCHHLH